MISDDLKETRRLFRRHPGFTAMNILSLILGISSCLLIILYITFEINFDRFHEKGKNIYRVVMKQPGNQVFGSSSDWWVVSPAILKPTWEKEIPEIDLISRTQTSNMAFSLGDQMVTEKVIYVDPEFLEIFTFPLKEGNKSDALKNPYSVIISEKMAKKYFGDEDPLGKHIISENKSQLKVTGVLKNIPNNSHLQFDFLLSFNTMEQITGKSIISNNWMHNSYITYLTLNNNTDLEALDSKLRKYDIDGFNGKKWSFHLQPLYDIHFNQDIRGTGNKGTIFIFFSIGLFILFVACFNYMNLMISHYRTRLKAVSIKKIHGAFKKQLVKQFLNQAVVMVGISYLVSLGIVWLLLPWFNDFLELNLEFRFLWNLQNVSITLGLLIVMVLISGGYPALYLSKVNLVSGLKGGNEKLSKGGQFFKKSVIAIQYSVSILLIVGSLTVFKQIRFVDKTPLGFQKDCIIYINMIDYLYRNNSFKPFDNHNFKQELLKNSNVISVAGSTGIPTEIGWSNIPVWSGKAEGENPFFYRLNVDYDFFDLYGIKIEEGRKFNENQDKVPGNAFIINRAAADYLGFNPAVGEQFGFDGKLGNVIGVTENFHFESLHKPVTPLGIGILSNDIVAYISIKLNAANIQQTIKEIEKTWSQFAPDALLNYSFIDEHVHQLYLKDRQLSESMRYFSLMALFICCLGIFGMMSFSVKEKTKEIGIRKVLGAPIHNLINLFIKEILIIVGIATVIGGTFGWYVSKQWLGNFAFHFNMKIDIIVFASLLALIITTIPICYKLIKAVLVNPAKIIRTE